MEEKDKTKQIPQEELDKIREFTRKDMDEDEIYTFPLILCDNEIDRDCEKFTTDALRKLARLFVGKTGIFDHNMSSRDQTARIYSAQVETDPSRTTKDGEIYTFVRAKAYMVRNEKNKDLISEIDAGIKKETSVGCSVKQIKCSVCGKDIRTGACEHHKGEKYGGKTCCYLLCEPEDAYEWSFVAVPAQKNAGVIKSYQPDGAYPGWVDEYRAELKEKAAKCASGVIPSMSGELLEKICTSLNLRTLRELTAALEKEAGRHLPLVRQLAPEQRKEKTDNNEFRI